MADDNVLKKVLDKIDDMKTELVNATSALVQIPSVHGEEAEAQAFMKARYEELGLAVETFEADLEEIKAHPAYIDTGHTYDDRPNVVGILDGLDDAPSLILNGHVDVVSPEPIDKWTADPWGGEVKEGRMYGRGVYDMKAGVMANLFATRAILESGLKPKGRLILQSVIEEEAGGSGGALACFLKGYSADGMLVPEPSNHNVVISHAGVKYFRVKVLGKTAHAALSHTGVNAIGKMNQIYNALIDLDERRAAQHDYPLLKHYSSRSCNLNIGTYRAGDWASSVAGMAEMECRVGFVPGEKGADVMREVEDTISSAVRDDDWLKENPPEVTWYGWDTEPWVQDENDGFVQAFLSSSTEMLGEKPNLTGFPGALDTRFAPYFGVPSLTFGPKGDRLHGPDEYVEIDSLVTVTKVIAKFILDWCGHVF
ncbi:MAG: ArgE/DapE family deacylase [Deltaproteobacteria bacterium]|nr:ArgE/DapE family deacylase [Deltaproteobacteria bacterium]